VLTDDTADLSIALMLMAARRAGEGERHLRAGAWTGWRPTHMMGTRVSGKTLGIVGFGRIGRAVARRAHYGFGMRVVVHTPHPPAPGVCAAVGAEALGSLEAVLDAADVLSLHCPARPATRGLIDATALARLGPHAILVNTARGGIVDEAALAEALASGAIAAAGLDVHEREPEVTPALLGMENVVLLPHLGSATTESRVGMGMRAIENLERFFSGRPLRDPVA
jgi:lactate dehydrogenase-like 2-hydroxyacid dehydrogenase